MQVKFRGKTESGEWVYGYLFEDENGCFIKQGKRSHRYGSGIAVAPESIGMFTGLCDKNGNEIYGAIGEKGGDIVETPHGKEYVEFSEAGFFAIIYQALKPLGDGTLLSKYVKTHTNLNVCEVVGTVIDNPELLGQ